MEEEGDGDFLSEWIYKILTEQTVQDLERSINEIAENGWEPINISSEGAYGKNSRFHCLIRRLK